MEDWRKTKRHLFVIYRYSPILERPSARRRGGECQGQLVSLTAAMHISTLWVVERRQERVVKYYKSIGTINPCSSCFL
ncbi:hypothetical protein EJB05_37371, partial [Eragrostis curvula]